MTPKRKKLTNSWKLTIGYALVDFAGDDLHVEKVHVEAATGAGKALDEFFLAEGFLAAVALGAHLLVFDGLSEASAIVGSHLESGALLGVRFHDVCSLLCSNPAWKFKVIKVRALARPH